MTNFLILVLLAVSVAMMWCFSKVWKVWFKKATPDEHENIQHLRG